MKFEKDEVILFGTLGL